MRRTSAEKLKPEFAYYCQTCGKVASKPAVAACCSASCPPPSALPSHCRSTNIAVVSWRIGAQVLDDLGGARRITDSEAQNNAGGVCCASASSGAGGDCHSSQADQAEHLRHLPADIVCALNFSLCLLHTPEAALAYLRCGKTRDAGPARLLNPLSGCDTDFG